MAIVSKNSVHGVLYLVLTFFSAAWVLLLLNAEFLALLLIVVYVGAIAVLFLFVVMMLQTRYNHKVSGLQTVVAVLIAVMIFAEFSGFLMFRLVKNEGFVISNVPLLEVSRLIYIENFVNFQLLGLVLLVGMVAVILLTQKKSTTFVHRQNVASQVLRKKEDSIENTSPEIGKGVSL
jgi:NADH-quinone oxidoreductase subunit J